MEKKLAILGGGESGTGAAILGQSLGYRVWLSDRSVLKDSYRTELTEEGISFEEGAHTIEKILDADMIVKSPGIPETAEPVILARQKGIPVISEIEFACRHTHATLIGITGTNGKTTTTLLTHHILRKAGLNAGLAGNVGQSLARQVAREQYDYYVIELSSFQLDGMYETRLHRAVLLNITPDHLDRYLTLDKYIKSKFRITQNQKPEDLFIYCADDEVIVEHMAQMELHATGIPFSYDKKFVPGAWVENEQIHINLLEPKINFNMNLNQLTISGRHNAYNSMAAAVVANSLFIRNEVIRESLSDFKNVEHRLEYVASVKGVDYINDSKATNVNAVWYALESAPKPIIWIAGGVDKGNDYEMLKPLVNEKVRVLICLGKNNINLHHAFGGDVEMIMNAGSAKEAVDMACLVAKNGETVLLSPACASFDLFDDYQDRGRQFKQAVRQL